MESNNQNFKFKTNINCSGCVASVKSHLDSAEGISEWSVDTSDKDKILTIKSEGITKEAIMKTVERAGFKIETLS